MKSDAIASVEQRNAVQQEKIAQADEFAMQILIPATDLESLNTLRSARGTSTATQTASFQTFYISGQSAYALKLMALGKAHLARTDN